MLMAPNDMRVAAALSKPLTAAETVLERTLVKVLVAEDEPVSRLRLQAFLSKWGYTVLAAPDGAEALRILEHERPRLVVLDRMMPHVDGLDICRTIRQRGAEPYVYVILLTAQDEPDEIVAGFQAGADDYITKPFAVQELEARVRTGARIAELQEQLIAARERLRIEATHDSLTGLLNRTAFFDGFHKEVTRARRYKTPLALIMADLDHFKAINDRHGHPIGDAVLRETARRLRGSIRASDVIGRYGGEEFIVAAPDCNMQDAMALAERFRTCICGLPIPANEGEVLVTMSLGVAATCDMDEADRLLHVADEALYRAKHAGRNKVEVEVVF
jgi:two-component system, cell cycle response regulator